jgi:hypothetical protein
LRDLDFGPSSDGGGRSLYITEFSNGIGTIYELVFAEPDIIGKPAYHSGAEDGLYIWKDTYDGPYHVDISGSGPLTQFSFELLTDKPIERVTPRQLEANDILLWNDHHLTFDGWVTTWIDGVDFQLPLATQAIIAVAQDGHPSPRQLHIGASGLPLSPSGWIIESDILPPPPVFQGGQDLGLFIGRDSASGEARARWNGDGPNHRVEIKLLFSQIPHLVTPIGLEANDVFTFNDNTVSINSIVSTWWDGLDIILQAGTHMGIEYTQDGLIQTGWVNPKTHSLGLPNAYRLPRAEPYGAPAYDPATEAGLYLWQDKATATWRLRGAAGGGAGRFSGEIVTDKPFTSVSAVRLEANDVLDTTDPARIVFDLRMWKQWEDGIDFRATPGAQLTLNLTSAHPFTSPARAVRVGNLKWPVESLPLGLGSW